MKQLPAIGSLAPRPKRYIAAIILIIIVVGVVDSVFVAVSNDIRSRNYLVGRASTISSTLSVDDIKQLKGNTSDTSNPAYQHLKQRLIKIRQQNRDMDYVYLMAKKNGKVVFLVDSTDPSVSGYSPPGQVFENPSSKLKNSFSNPEPFSEGPVRDSWGIWISAISPVTDPKNDQVVSVVGYDVPAQSYYGQILLIAAVPFLLAMIPVFGLLRDRKVIKKQQEIGALKSQFVAIASHELRSPLTGMLWAIQSLLSNKTGNLTKEQLKLLEDMSRSTEFSVATINEILDLSIFERGKKLRSRIEKVDMAAVVREVIKTLGLGAQEKNIDIVMAQTWPAEAYTEGDVAALKRAIMNIISNAVKYGFKESTVTIAYRKDKDQHIIAVLNQGIGIPKEEQEKIFSGYFRAPNAMQAESHGTGLGLFISKLIIEEHHGRIWLTSSENKITTVYISLPAKD